MWENFFLKIGGNNIEENDAKVIAKLADEFKGNDNISVPNNKITPSFVEKHCLPKKGGAKGRSKSRATEKSQEEKEKMLIAKNQKLEFGNNMIKELKRQYIKEHKQQYISTQQ